MSPSLLRPDDPLLHIPQHRWAVPEVQDDATNEDQEKQKKAAVDLSAARQRKVVTDLLANPHGREWAWGVLKGCELWADRSIVASQFENGFQEGGRWIGLRLLRELARASPENFARMIAENYV